MNLVNKTHRLEVALTVDTDAYTDGDVIGGRFDLSDLCGGGGGGTIRQIRLVDDDSVGAALSVYLFDGQPTDVADDAAFATAMTAADLKKLIAKVDIAAGDYVTLNANDYVLKDDVDISHGNGQLWGYLVANGSTPNFTTATALTLYFVGWLD